MKILIIGGHLTPALAVMESFPKGTEIVYVGRKHALEGDSAFSLEYQTITKLKILFEEIKTARLQRKFTFHTIPSLMHLPLGFVSAFSILNKFKPDVVVGFGGYVSLPIGVAAKFLGIPLVIHEQALKPGLANKILARFADKICVSWEKTLPFFPKGKVVFTGLPIRKFQVSSFKFQVSDKLPSIYITGGSLGSHFINTLIEASLKELLINFSIIHQTGDAKEYRDFDRLNKLKEGLPDKLKERYMLEKFVDPKDVGSIIQQSSLVVSRSGINTMTELIMIEKPALLIPLPFLEEQIKNAEFFKSRGFGETIFQKNAASNTASLFIKTINKIFNSLDLYKKNLHNSKYLIRKDAASNIIKVIEDVIKSKKK